MISHGPIRVLPIVDCDCLTTRRSLLRDGGFSGKARAAGFTLTAPARSIAPGKGAGSITDLKELLRHFRKHQDTFYKCSQKDKR